MFVSTQELQCLPFFHIFNAIVSGKLWLVVVFTCDGTFVSVVYVHGWCWNSGITATDFVSSFTAPHLQATENAFGVILYKNTDNVELDLIFSIIEKNVWLRSNFHYCNCVAEVNTEKPILLRQKPQQLPTAEVNYEDCYVMLLKKRCDIQLVQASTFLFRCK